MLFDKILNLRNFEKVVAYAIVSLFAVTCATILFWQFQSPNQIRFYDVAESKHIVRAGEHIYIKRKFCSGRNGNFILKRTIRDGITYQMEDKIVFIKRGCFERTITLVIPEALSPGFYIYDTYGVMKINPLKSQTVAIQPIQFVVVNPDGTIPSFEYPEVKELIREITKATPKQEVVKERKLTQEEINNSRPTEIENRVTYE